MTSKFKCPVCQQDLGIILCDTDDLVCDKCRMCGTENLWQALIQAKQDLKTATKALENIISDYEVDASNGWLATNAKKALKQIRHKE